MREKLLELASACEKASGPDRELDADIHRIACGIVCCYPLLPPAYTVSLDAAMTLIPTEANSAGEIWRAEGYSDPGVLAPHVRASAWVAGSPRVYAATSALALTAAALRARAQAGAAQ